jgi:hypothetical protein
MPCWAELLDAHNPTRVPSFMPVADEDLGKTASVEGEGCVTIM